MQHQTKWFSQSPDEIKKSLDTDPEKGLSDDEARSRLEKYGPNKVKERKKKPVWKMFLEQLQDVLIYILLAAIVVTFFMGEYIDSIVIFVVIVVNATLGVFQEVKAGNAIEALSQLTSPKALVRRNGKSKEIDSENVVPGDILILEAGAQVTADVRLIETVNLSIEESSLTGESVPVEKSADDVPEEPDPALGDRTNMAYKSTLITYGRGIGIVVATGMETEVGKIAGMLDQEDSNETPLEIRLDELGKIIGLIAIGVCVVMFGVGWLQGRDLMDMFLISVSLAVASIPEGLAAIVAVVLSIGVTRMARRNAIIKQLPAVETLGSVSVVCTDKTGTLTQNKMTVVKYFTMAEGDTEVPEDPEQASDEARTLAKALILCSDATYEDGEATGDPTEIAFLVFGDQVGLDRNQINRTNAREKEIPFESERKLMSTLENEEGRLRVFVKGAVGALYPLCTKIRKNGEDVQISDDDIQRFRDATNRMSDEALRTLAVAYKPVDHVIEESEMEKDLVLLGVVGMIDPPRAEAKGAIQRAKQAGVTPVMITGDHKVTAFAIAKDLGIATSPDQAISGGELDKMPGEEARSTISNYTVFARVSPEHKVKIVKAFKDKGNIVSMTGDGVNDAPSLQTADIGVAMGITGTEVAKNSADIILTDDNFATIISAIEQGRNIYNNIKKSVVFLLASNSGEVITMVTAIGLGLPAPLYATQLLWINLLTDTLPAVALGMDPGDPGVMNQSPRHPKEGFFAHGALRRIITGGFLIGALTLLGFWLGFSTHGASPFDSEISEEAHQYATTMAFMTIVSCQLLYSLTFRHPTKSIFQTGLWTNKYLLGAIVVGFALQLLVMGIPFMQKAFKLQMLDQQGWLIVIGLGLVPLFLNELIKLGERVAMKRKSKK